MKKHLLIVLFLLVFGYAQNAPAQGLQTEIKVQRPNLSGTWKLNLAQSKGLKDELRTEAGLQRLMVIQQNLPAISITVKLQKGATDGEEFVGGKYTLFSDGRGDQYVAEFDAEDSSTVWENGKLVVTRYSVSKTTPKTIVAIQELALSPDGKTLIETWRRTSFRYVSNPKDGTSGEERYFDDSKNLVLVYDKVK
jgi:hypothetical protein